MKRMYGLLFLGASLLGTTLRSNEVDPAQALENHKLEYASAEHPSKETLADLFLAQDAKDMRRVQIKALNQFSTGEDAELRFASCGFHAFRNGITCALGLINKDRDHAAFYKISSADDANDFFGAKLSPWRIEIGKMRNELTARKVAREMIFKELHLKKEGSDRDFDLLMSCIGSMILPVFAQPEIWEDGFHYSASKKEIHNALVQRAYAQSAESGNRMKALIKSGILDTYFKGEFALDFIIDFEGNCYRASHHDHVLATVPHDMHGNWVQTDEMPFLVNSQRGDDGILAEEPTLLVATYGEDLGGTEQHAFASEKFMKLYSLVRDTKHDCVGVVLVYLPGEPSAHSYTVSAARKVCSLIESCFPSAKTDSSFAEDAKRLRSGQDDGHWISLVVSRIKGDLRYYLLDSCNVNRLRNVRINEVIDMFDGKKELPGYDWTAQQIAKSLCTLTPKATDFKKSYSWKKIGLSVAAVGLLTYGAYYLYSQRKKKNNP